ncbi:MAG TPA: hypothetical protein VLT45_16360, partial [Kofleriaceae bacterium]|nr:hypothetical protein [Kofleriaceae bacterium]
IVLRCLAKSPEQRYASMAELGRDLIPFVQDVHQASLLVERMQRMLSRSTFNWESHSTGVSRTPAPARQRAMTPPAVWGAGSDPAASPWAGKSEPNAQPWQARDGSAPYPKQMLAHEPSAPMQAVVTMDVRPKRRWPLLLGALALLGLGGAIAAVAVSHTDVGAAKTEQKAATEIKATTVPVEPPKQPVPVIEQPKQAAVEAPAATGSGSAAMEKVETKVETPRPPIKKTPPKTHEVVKTVPKTGQETKASEPPPQTAPVLQKPKCDPFASMHDCNSK